LSHQGTDFVHSIGPSQLGRDRGQRHGNAGGQHKNGP